MAGTVFPLGNPRRVITDPAQPPRPVPLDPIEESVHDTLGAIRRGRTSVEPPENVPADPWLVPKALWRQVQAQGIRRSGSALAIQREGEDLAFNVRVQADTESAMGQFDRPPAPTVPGIKEQRELLGLLHSRVDDTLSKIQPLPPLTAPSPIFTPRAQPVRAAPEPLTGSQSRGSGFLGKVAQAAGNAFDGRGFVKQLTVNTVLAADRLTGSKQFGGNRDLVERRFDELYEELPRPAQLVIDELSPASIGLAVAGGPIAKLVGGSGVRGGRVIASVLRPMTEGAGAFPRQVAAGVGGRIGYEYTDGAPMPVRLAVGAAGAILGGNPDAVLSPSWKYVAGVWQSLGDGSAVPEGSMLMHAGLPAVKVGAGNVGMGLAGAGVGALQGETIEERGQNAAVGFGVGFGVGTGLFRGVKPRPFQPPDVIPLNIPSTAQGLSFPNPVPSAARFARTDAVDYAADLAGQQQMTVPGGVAWALQRAREAIRPGQAIENIIGELPMLSDAYARFFNPSQRLPMNVRQAFWAQGATTNEIATRLAPSRRYFLDGLAEAFGGLDDIDPALVRYIGPAGRPLANKLVDVMEHPTLYDLSDAQRDMLRRFDARNTAASEMVRGEHGVKIGDFTPGDVDAIFVPIVDKEGVTVRNPNVSERLMAMTGRAKERTFNSVADRLADPVFGPNFKPETNVGLLFDRLDAAKASAAGNEVFKWGVGGQLERDAVGFFEISEFGVHVTKEVKDALEYLKGDTNSRVLNSLENWRQVRLNGDMSPLTIQGALSWFASPWGTTKQMISGLVRGEFNISDIASSQRMLEKITADPESWLDFAFHTGLSVDKGTPAEFKAGLLEKIPLIGKRGIGPMNENTFNLVQLGMKRQWDEMSAMLIREGTTPEAAKAAAADMVTKIVPMVDTRKLGMSASRAKWERALATSVSFIRQPVAFVGEAASGYVKLGLKPAGIASGTIHQWATLTPQERLATQTFAVMNGAITGMAVTSAIMSADERNLSPLEAAKRALDPTGGDFWRLWLNGSFSIPLGGPYRSLARAVAPRDGVPFAGLLPFAEGRGPIPSYARSRLTPSIGAAVDIIENRDFSGAQIVNPNEGMAENIADALSFAAEQVVPIAPATGLESRRLGYDPDTGWQQVVTAFAGQSGNDISPREGIEVARRGGINALFETPTEDNLIAAGLTSQQATAAVGATSLEGLREAIGTRAANALADRVSVESPAAMADYRADLQRRAERGDRTAEALVVEFELQDRLTRTAEGVMRGGQIVDRVAYREQRSDLMAQSIGQSDAYREIFEGFRKSENEIDQLSAQWYDLFDRAKKPNGIVDFKVFGSLEEQFYSGLGAEKAALVQGNVETAPRGANPLEVELRQVRMDLETTGLFKVDDALWERVKTGATPELRAKVGAYQTFEEYRAAAAEQIAQKLIGNGWRPAEALRFADVHSNYDPIVAAFDEAAQGEKAKWAMAHEEVAQKAIDWGYLSPSILNVAASREKEQPAATPAAGQQATPELQTMADAFLAGQSYGQLGIRFDKSAGAVEQALRRYFGGSPDEARKKAQASPAE